MDWEAIFFIMRGRGSPWDVPSDSTTAVHKLVGRSAHNCAQLCTIVHIPAKTNSKGK